MTAPGKFARKGKQRMNFAARSRRTQDNSHRFFLAWVLWNEFGRTLLYTRSKSKFPRPGFQTQWSCRLEAVTCLSWREIALDQAHDSESDHGRSKESMTRACNARRASAAIQFHRSVHRHIHSRGVKLSCCIVPEILLTQKQGVMDSIAANRRNTCTSKRRRGLCCSIAGYAISRRELQPS